MFIRARLLIGAIVSAVAAAPAAPSMLSTLASVDRAHMGQPFVEGMVSSSLDSKLMDYAHMGQPFVRWIA